jgi:hypothetical protein
LLSLKVAVIAKKHSPPQAFYFWNGLSGSAEYV